MSTLATVFGYGLLSARAAASVAGRFYYATDTQLMYRDNGSTWDTLGLAGAGTGTLTTVKDEGSNLSTAVVSLDFVGAGVTATGTTAVTVTVPLPSAHGCRVKRASTTFSIGNNTYTSVAFDAEDYDTDSMHDTVTNNTRITIPTIAGVTTGLWSITAHGYLTGQTLVDSKVRLNGTTDISFHRENDGGVGTFLNTCSYVLSATDYIECQLRSPSGTASTVFDAGISPLFEVAFLGKVT